MTGASAMPDTLDHHYPDSRSLIPGLKTLGACRGAQNAGWQLYTLAQM